jgi:K+-transporting ATPase c subunit
MTRKKRSPNRENRTSDVSTIVKTISSSRNKLRRLKDPVENYGYRQVFVPAEFDLALISRIENGETYVKQAFNKKNSLMFKEGEVFSGKNEKTIDYIKTRIRQMEYVTGISWRNLLKQTGKELISKSNFFWVKVRSSNASGGSSGVGKKNPVAGYFPMGAENVTVKKNKSGKIIKYRQDMPGGKWKEWSPEDIIHFKCHVRPGMTFGTPEIVPVIPDIQALRRLEENVEILFYQTLFPIFQYKVGTESKPATQITLPDGSVIDEVEYIRAQIANMPSEGGIVTPERHEIKYIGAEGQIPDYKHVLQYFKSRVLAGLGISSLDIGDGDTANRATADSLSKALIDSVKSFQDVMEEIVNAQVVSELLLESSFSFDPLISENFVELQFIEIDIEEQMKKNVNAQLLFAADIWDINEVREVTGKQPIEEYQEALMYTERQTLKVLSAESEQAIELTKIAASVAPKPAGSTSASTKTKKKATSATKTAKNSSTPTNQYGKKTGPQKSRLDRAIRNEERVLERLRQFDTNDSEDFEIIRESAKLRVRAKALEISDEEERETFILTSEIRLDSI